MQHHDDQLRIVPLLHVILDRDEFVQAEHLKGSIADRADDRAI